MNTTQNEQVITIIERDLNGHGQVIVEAARSVGLDPALACALVEQESGGRNIFGCAHGPVGDRPPYCHQEITRDRVRMLSASPYMKGIGLRQLTRFTFVEEAEVQGDDFANPPLPSPKSPLAGCGGCSSSRRGSGRS